MKIRHAMTIVAVLGLLTAGCAPLIIGAAGAGAGVMYLRGALNSSFPASVPQVTEATDMALRRMQMFEIEITATATESEVRARSATDDRIRIDISSAAQGVSDISIRVGTFGDEQKSLVIYDNIRDQLIRLGYVDPSQQ